MPQAITTDELIKLRHGIQIHGLTAVVEAYEALYDKDYNYAGWAKGVATGEAISGQAALSYLNHTALMGTFGNSRHQLTSLDINKIRVEMAAETLDRYIQISTKTNGTLNRDFHYEEIKEIHKVVFENNKLTLDNWTLHIPMEVIRSQAGDAAVEERWEDIRETGGDDLDATAQNISLVMLMLESKDTAPDPATREKISKWLDQFSDFVDWAIIIKNASTKSADAILKELHEKVDDCEDKIESYIDHLEQKVLGNLSQPSDTSPSP